MQIEPSIDSSLEKSKGFLGPLRRLHRSGEKICRRAFSGALSIESMECTTASQADQNRITLRIFSTSARVDLTVWVTQDPHELLKRKYVV